MVGILIKIILRVLQLSTLSEKDTNLLITGILDKLNALPIRDIIVSSDGQLKINGRPVGIEQAVNLRESAKHALENYAEKLIEEQILFTAITIGVHKADSEKSLMFAKAAIWYEQQRKSFLRLLAQDATPAHLQE